MEFLDLILLKSDALRLFGIKVYNDDLWELLVRLALNTIVSYIIILKMYRSTQQDSEYVFTYLIFSPLVFFVCHLFAATDLSIGFAFGLFAVFSILRYRTTTIPVKEMTYMFIIIAVAVLNAISTKKVSHIELLFTNFFIIALLYFLEKAYSKGKTSIRTINYEIIEHIKPENEHLLLAELKNRTGKEVIKYEILETDYLKDAALITVHLK